MNHDEKVRAARQIHELARQYRGRFLNDLACIEHDMANLLADYFCPANTEKRAMLYEEVFTCGSFSLEKKKRLFLEIVKRDYPSYFDENKEILAAFKIVQEFRNKLAHSRIDVSETALARPLEEGVGFTDWHDAKPISQVEFDEFGVKANMISACIKDVQRLLPLIEKK